MTNRIALFAEDRGYSFSRAFQVLVTRGVAILEAELRGEPAPRFVYRKCASAKPPASVVYFIRCSVPIGDGRVDSRVKIGFTRGDPAARITTFETGNPFPMAIAFTARGGLAEEKRLHERFSAYRVAGSREWFHEAGELAEYIAERTGDRR
jgi:hypothetical protein